MAAPVRTCIGCRRRAEQADLLRIVWDPATGPRPDPARTEPGRGAYLHRSAGCLELAIKRRALARALRLTARPVDPAAFRQAVEELVAPGR